MKNSVRGQVASNSFGKMPLSSLFCLAFGLVAATSALAQDSGFSAADMRQTVNTYCLACHNDFLAESDLSLQSVDFSRPSEYADELERMVKKLQAHMMPPADMPRPPFEAYEVMTYLAGIRTRPGLGGQSRPGPNHAPAPHEPL